MKYYKDIVAIFEDIRSYKEDLKHKKVKFSTRGYNFTFNNLEQLSILLGTKNINMYSDYDGCSGHDEDSRCECTGGSFVEITCVLE